MKKTSITLAAATILGLSLLASNADAQSWRNSFGWSSHGNSSCSQSSRVNLRADVSNIDRLANQMVCQFSREMHSRCSCSITLLNHLKKNAALTRNLVVASNGSCKCAFEKAACAVNTNMKCVAKQSRKVRNLSCSMKYNISEASTLARRIHDNVDQFRPRNSMTNYGRRPAPAPVYGRPPIDNHAGHNHNTNQRAVSSLIYSLFNR